MNFLKVFKVLANECHGRAVKNGWGDKKSTNIAIGLMASEIYEAFEGERSKAKDDHEPLSHRDMVEVELADFAIRSFDTVDAWELVMEENEDTAGEYNKHFSLEGIISYPENEKPDGLSDFEQAIWIMKNYKLATHIPPFEPSGNLAEDLVDLSHLTLRILEEEEINFTYFMSLIMAADVIAKHYGYDIWGALVEKLDYNDVRADHKKENREKEGGKKF